MKILRKKYAELTNEETKRLFERSSADYDQVKKEVFPIMQNVKNNGDSEILKKYKKRNIPINTLCVSREEYEFADKNAKESFLDALNIAKENIKNVCLAQKKSLEDIACVENNEIKVWREWRQLDSVGIYVPGGRANYPSSLLMAAVPALVGGCREIVVCVPPDESGAIPAEVLVTAKELGISKVFKVGGPQAIAVMAYGTESIPRVQKIVGPGNQYVTAAKLLVYPETAIDLPAGPSENLIIADEYANPKFVAADLITDTEHGPDSTAILLTFSKQFAMKVEDEINALLKNISTKETIYESLENYGAIIIMDSMQDAVKFSNNYAPEHMQIFTKNPQKIAKQIVNAGSVFIGQWSAKAGGDYATGANHILPTGLSAKMFGGVSVDSFGKWVEFQEVSKEGFYAISEAIETYADVEGLPAHKVSSTVRKEV